MTFRYRRYPRIIERQDKWALLECGHVIRTHDSTETRRGCYYCTDPVENYKGRTYGSIAERVAASSRKPKDFE
jgi:hypothetical protein